MGETKKHDWRGGPERQWCVNVGCHAERLPQGVAGDERVRYRRTAGSTPVLKPYPCTGARNADGR
jgi:hypothetical protein